MSTLTPQRLDEVIQSDPKFWSKVTIGAPDECWPWQLQSRKEDGYGWVNRGGKPQHASRWAWQLVHGPIPDGLHVLHHCDNPPCCNAFECLFLGPPAVNNHDMWEKGRGVSGYAVRQLRKEECPQGHRYDEENTVHMARGSRRCRTCHNDKERERKREARAK